MAAPPRFVAPEPTGWWIALVRAALPLLLRGIGIRSIHYSGGELDRYRGMARDRVLIVPNHPTNADPAILFHLGATARTVPYFLACRESFDAWFGAWGWCIRRLGAYSLVRGTTDRPSFKATRDLLSGQGNHVVVFPEGEVYSQNDSLLPYHEGPFQLAFWALESARRTAPDATILVQPVAVKYFLAGISQRAVRASLARLENHVKAPTGPSDDDYDRLRAIAWSMLRSLEREYRIPFPDEDDWHREFDTRLRTVKEAILSRVSAAVGIDPPAKATLPERMRALIHALEVVTAEGNDESSPYEHQLHRIQRDRARPLLKDLERLATFIAVHDGYVAENPTLERLCDTLVRLERECFGRTFLRRSFRVRVALLEPIDLSAWLAEYTTNRSDCLSRLVRSIESGTLAALRALEPPTVA